MATTAPLATAEDFTAFASAAELVQDDTVWTPAALDKLMMRATKSLERRSLRRFALFTGKLESHRAYGISPDEYGEQGDLPLDLSGAMGMSQAAAYGVSDMVREFWLDECAAACAEDWTYTLRSVEILRTFGDSQMFTEFPGWQGPEADTGHVKMPIGTYCPIGSTIRVVYDGGFTPVPDDLQLACIYQAMKLVMVGIEPESRMSTAELDDELLLLMAPFLGE